MFTAPPLLPLLLHRRASSDLQVARGRRLRRFVCYTLFVWVLTSAVVAAAVLTDQAARVPTQYRPGFGQRMCWFSRRQPLAIFFAAPLAATMVTNAALFVAIVRLIRRMGSASAKATSHPRVSLRKGVMSYEYHAGNFLSASGAVICGCFVNITIN